MSRLAWHLLCELAEHGAFYANYVPRCVTTELKDAQVVVVAANLYIAITDHGIDEYRRLN